MNEQETRSAEWGHWGITFISWLGPTQPYLCTIHGQLYFAVGARGPCDGYVGSPTRLAYQQAVRQWMEAGVLPAGLDRRHATAGAR